MEESKVNVPTNFYCPITGDLMKEPVSDKEGNSYEKTQIIMWLGTSKTSPITRNYLDETAVTTLVNDLLGGQTLDEAGINLLICLNID